MVKCIMKAMAFVVISVLLIASFGTVVDGAEAEDVTNYRDFIDSKMQACYEAGGKVSADNKTVYASSAVGIWDCFWHPFGLWEYNFKIGGTGYSDGNMIGAAFLTINTDSSGVIINDRGNSQFIWSLPSSNSSDSEWAWTVSNLIISVTMSAVAGLGANVAWAAISTLISAMGNGANQHTQNDNNFSYFWKWSSNVNETHQQVWFYAHINAGATVKINLEYSVLGPTYEVLSPGKMTLTINAPDTNGVSPSEMTAEERAKNGILTVKKSELSTIAYEANMTSETLEQLLALDEEEYYFGSVIPTCSIESPGYNESRAESVGIMIDNYAVTHSADSVTVVRSNEKEQTYLKCDGSQSSNTLHLMNCIQ